MISADSIGEYSFDSINEGSHGGKNMKTTFSPTLLGAASALVASATVGGSAHADSVVTINPDGSVAQVESAQSVTQQTFNSGADSYTNYGGNSVGRNRRSGSRGNTRFEGYSGNAAGVNTASPDAYGYARDASGARQGVQTQGRSTLRNATPLHRGGNRRDERDIIIDGDDNTVIIWPGNGYGYYPPNWGGYPVHGYPGYRSPWYGYPIFRYPQYGYPRYTALPPYVSAPNFGFYPSIGSRSSDITAPAPIVTSTTAPLMVVSAGSPLVKVVSM
jgi:hypothetical protein